MLEIERIGFWEEIKTEVQKEKENTLKSDITSERVITTKEISLE